MIYVINEHLRYDPLSATLSSLENHHETLTLSRVNNGIMFLFVNNNNKLISRSDILKEIWENQGIDSSNNNLNNHISILRKSLAQCGCNEIIKTIPKNGLIFSANSVTSLARERETPHTFNESTASEKKNLKDNSIRNRHAYNILRVFILISLAILIVFFAPKVYEEVKISSYRKEVFRLEQCRFYTTDDDTKLLSSEEIKYYLDVFLKEQKIDCSELKSNVYLFSRENKDALGRDAIFQLISYCPYNTSAQCINYKEYSLK
ncbi:winged helix-turn-helix domain-containing protein [Serratia sarumanii]|uniref:winged helix-turn-helix domain-containing protein n=1 Tax=Serratia sarumanii TaxID=3020826 RepID=UPI003F8228F4